MKINAINNSVAKHNYRNNTNNYTTNVVNNNTLNLPRERMLCDKNYGILQTKKMNVNFKGAGLPAPTKNLGEKVANLFNVVRSNDVIVAAPSISHAVQSIDKNINSFKKVLKRVFFVEDKNLEGAVAFQRNLADKEVINLSEKKMFVKDAKGSSDYIKEGERAFLLDGDTVSLGKVNIPIKDKVGTDLPIANSYTNLIEFDEAADPQIKKINKKLLEQVKETTEIKGPKKITFADVGGQDAAIKELKKNILYPIKYPEIKNGKNMRKSVILSGPPGTGKSLIAEATANESGAWFKKINASELDSKFVGESEENWRNLFDEARENQPSIIFIDEIDAIAKKRGGQDVYGDKTLNTILGLMSDSEKRGDEIYLIAATNNKGLLDSAVTRSGRFGVDIPVGAPDLAGTKQIFDIHTKTEPLAKDLDKEKLTKRMHDAKATGADIASISEDARNNAMEREKIYEKMENGTYTPDDMANLTLKTEDFDKAIDSFAKKQAADTPAQKPRNPIGYTSPIYKNR